MELVEIAVDDLTRMVIIRIVFPKVQVEQLRELLVKCKNLFA